MNQARYPYPRDEFDVAETSGGPRGAHRAPRTLWARWWPFVVTVVVFPLIAYALVTNLSDWTSGRSPLDAILDPSPSATEPAPEAEETAEPTPEPTEEPAPEPPAPVVDLARPVQVLNATSTSGLAARAADTVTAAGFTDVTADNYPDAAGASAVFYPTEADVATAQAVADALGITQVTLAPDRAPDGIVAVLASDYAEREG